MKTPQEVIRRYLARCEVGQCTAGEAATAILSALAEAGFAVVPPITDEMCRRAIAAQSLDRIQGFSTPGPGRRTWGAPHWVIDTHRPRGQEEVWRGDSHDEMMERCAIEEMRIAIQAAIAPATHATSALAKSSTEGDVDGQ